MENRDEKGEWLSVPQFGDWDLKHTNTDYSLDFSKVREMRKQQKMDFSRISVGNEEEIVKKPNQVHQYPDQLDQHSHRQPQNESPTRMRNKIFSYFNCCIKA